MTSRETKLKGAFEIQLRPNLDARGYFMRTYDKEVFAEYGLPTEWVQESESLSRIKGTVRGMHFQYPPEGEIKAIRATRGETFLALVDLRRNSPTFGEWDAVILSADKHNVLIVPRGVANGMCSLTDNCVLVYKIDEYFRPASYDAIRWNDPELGIEWPTKVPAVISANDRNAQSFREFVAGHGGL